MKRLNTTETMERLQKGERLFLYESIKMAGNSFTSKILPGKRTSYKFEDGTEVHHTVGKSLLAKKIIAKGSNSVKTLGGWQRNLFVV